MTKETPSTRGECQKCGVRHIVGSGKNPLCHTPAPAEIKVCPIHDKTHYCEYKIGGAKCECKCTCPTKKALAQPQEEECSECGSRNEGQTGEYPCKKCGLPGLWDGEPWEEELRDYIDKTLKPRKPGMKNLDREIIIDFVRQTVAKAKAEERGRIAVIVAGKMWDIPMEQRQGSGMGWHNKDIQDILSALDNSLKE